jgi:hypothetical protein
MLVENDIEEYCLLGYNSVYPLNINRCFGATYRLHLQGRRISRAINQLESRWQAELSLFFDLEDGGDMLLQNIGLYSTDYTELYPRRWYSS